MSDERLKHLVAYFAKGFDELVGEVEVAPPSESELRVLLGVAPDDPLVGEYPMAAAAAIALCAGAGHDADPGRYDYFYERVVRSEFIATYYATEAPPYPPPEALPAFPNATRARPKTRSDS